MSTATPQLIHSFFTWLPLVLSVCSLAIGLYLLLAFHTKVASERLINTLRGEIADQSGDLNALRDRFSLFQKREHMRQARAEKSSQQDALAEAQAIVAAAGGAPAPLGQPGHGQSTKAALYAKRRQH